MPEGFEFEDVEEVRRELDLYAPVQVFLELRFRDLIRRQPEFSDCEIFSEVVAQNAGGGGGQWSRPDLAALTISRGDYIPFLRAELHTFEVKTATGASIGAVYETNANGRFGHFAWLVFQAVGPVLRGTDSHGQILKVAQALGTGVIEFDRPEDPTRWRISHFPKPTGVQSNVADCFVRERFSPEARSRIRSYLHSLGWQDRPDAE
ncbi:hypothetical protein GC169_03210 [bacterium]|nr:hypothetical protein [bacterium]